MAVSGGTIRIPGCYEGIEAVTIDVSGGDIEIEPEDDGLNANGGFSIFGGFGGMPERTYLYYGIFYEGHNYVLFFLPNILHCELHVARKMFFIAIIAAVLVKLY